MKMESKFLILALIVIAASTAISGAAKEESSNICGMSQSELMECKPAVAVGTAVPPPPTAPCCSSLKHANLTCFCNFKTNQYLPLFGINATRAVNLPSVCDPSQVAPCA